MNLFYKIFLELDMDHEIEPKMKFNNKCTQHEVRKST